MSRPEFQKCPQRDPLTGRVCERLNSHRGHTGDHIAFEGSTWTTWTQCLARHPERPAAVCVLPWGHTGAHESASGRIVWAATL